MRGHAQHIPTEIHDAMDNCGTGGTSLSVLIFPQLQPLSWLVAVFHMAKHGNRFRFLLNLVPQNVLEALGINLDLKPAELGKVFDKTGIVFLFAKICTQL